MSGDGSGCIEVSNFYVRAFYKLMSHVPVYGGSPTYIVKSIFSETYSFSCFVFIKERLESKIFLMIIDVPRCFIFFKATLLIALSMHMMCTYSSFIVWHVFSITLLRVAKMHLSFGDLQINGNINIRL